MANRKKFKESVSIVIPAYNEENRILPSLKVLTAFCEENFQQYEIICVDDGSTDKTWHRITEEHPAISFQALRLSRNQGKGYAVKHGMLHAEGQFRFFTDADLPYHLDAFHIAMKAFHTNRCSVVVGARELAPDSSGIKAGLLRRVAGSVFSSLTHILVGMNVRDFQCGFKGFSALAAERVFSRLNTSGYAFDVEIFTLARALDLSVCKIPATLVKQAGSKIRLSCDPFCMFADLLKIAIHSKRSGAKF
jgi:dolichyl-phosphate beta-glucosyltransferase